MPTPDWAVFFGLWLRNPRGLAAANPSGPLLADAIGRRLDLHRPGHVLELGAGTGGLTRGLLRNGCPLDRLVVIEREPEFVDVLRRRFPGLRVIMGDATRLGELLAGAGIGRLSTVISSLPIKWFPLAAQGAILRQSLALLGSGGRFLQITNAFSSPLPMRELAVEGEEISRVWLNLLPAQVWAYRQPAEHRDAREP